MNKAFKLIIIALLIMFAGYFTLTVIFPAITFLGLALTVIAAVSITVFLYSKIFGNDS